LHRIALGLEYDGSHYNGWQIQSHAPSIQGRLNDALSCVADEAVSCVGSGRTDTGVHAREQVVHFETSADRSLRSWLLGTNSNLPDDINVLWVRAVSDKFHARFSALSRTYRYLILNQPVRSALERQRAWWVREPLDTDLMTAGAASLLGKHDFEAFRASSCQSSSAVRELQTLSASREDDFITIECRANAFLHHMVRNIVGSLVKVGLGEQKPGWMAELLAQKDRSLAAITAPPHGLYFMTAEYPPEFDIPATCAGSLSKIPPKISPVSGDM